MIIQLHIEMKDVRTTQQAHEMGRAIADHLYDTFNDDDSIKRIQWKAINGFIREERTPS